MTLPQLIGLCAAWLVAIMSPGPDLLVVLQQSLTRSRRDGVLAAAGVLTGLGIWVLAALFGLAGLLEVFPQVLDGLQLAGGALLIILGLVGVRQAWLHRRSARQGGSDQVPVERSEDAPRRGLSAYWKGLGTNVSNPKALVFFAAILAPFLPRPLELASAALIVGVLLLLAAVWFVLVAMAASYPPLVARFQRATNALDLVASGLFVLIGAAFCMAVVLM